MNRAAPALLHRVRLLTLLILGAASSLAATDLRAADRPNFLLIVIDDLNHDVGYAGVDVQTPNLDRIAEQGRVFLNAHTNSPVCNPSRTSLLLGKYPHTIGVTDNNTYFRELPAFRDAVTIPQFFREHGYQSIGAGKIFHSGWRPHSHKHAKMLDRQRSWDRYHEIGVGTPRPRPVPNRWHGGRVGTWWANSFWWASIDATDKQTNDWKNADYIAKLLEEPPTDGQPLFLAAGIFRPHVPLAAPQRYFDLYPPETGTPQLAGLKANDRDDLPTTGRSWANKTNLQSSMERTDLWGQAVAAYRASTTFADTCVGRIFDAYQRSPIRDSTYLILFSDHGFQLGEKGAWAKFSFWDRSTRVPFIIVGPGIEPGVSNRTISLIDLYPTLASLADLPAPSGLEGHDLTPLLHDPNTPWPHPARVFFTAEQHEAVIDENFRYIRYANGEEELYDRRADPHDWHNLAGNPAHADILNRYRDKRWLPERDASAATP